MPPESRRASPPQPPPEAVEVIAKALAIHGGWIIRDRDRRAALAVWDALTTNARIHWEHLDTGAWQATPPDADEAENFLRVLVIPLPQSGVGVADGNPDE